MVNERSGFSRREFIRSSTLYAVAISIPVLGCKNDEVKDPDECETTSDILGPYYKAGAPLGENIIPPGVETPPLQVHGKVMNHCSVLISDAVVEIWNADAAGAYDTSEQFLFRGKYQTLSDGVYRFKTIIPGRYLNGSTYRPSHLHFRITAPGYRELVSQIYFRDDPYIESDPWAGAPAARERILTISKDANDVDTITFDIHLIEV